MSFRSSSSAIASIVEVERSGPDLARFLDVTRANPAGIFHEHDL